MSRVWGGIFGPPSTTVFSTQEYPPSRAGKLVVCKVNSPRGVSGRIERGVGWQGPRVVARGGPQGARGAARPRDDARGALRRERRLCGAPLQAGVRGEAAVAGDPAERGRGVGRPDLEAAGGAAGAGTGYGGEGV